MAGAGYERLSAQDRSFLLFDGGRGQLNICAVALFEPGPLLVRGALDVERLRAYVASRLQLLAHHRQRVDALPLWGPPIWVDDERFDLAHHVRHAALPSPGSRRQLRELAARIASESLDPRRPLWELWAVEGLEGGGFALVAKVHHCMVDGVSGVALAAQLLSPSPEASFEPACAWQPRPPPGLLELLGDGLSGLAQRSKDALRGAADALSRPQATASLALEAAASSVAALRAGFTPAARSALNQPIGRQRRLELRAIELAELRDLRKRLDGSLNDVVLALVAGALHHFLRERGAGVERRDLRVIVPVDTRTGSDATRAGNRVSAWFLDLPVGERDPRRRFERIRAQTRERKHSHPEQGVDLFLRFADWSGLSPLANLGVSLTGWLRPYNLIVTNVRGPELPLYLLGARLREFYPLLPLFEGQGLAVAALSYLGRLYFGLTADWDQLPDLERLGAALESSLGELRERAENPERRPPQRRPARERRLARGSAHRPAINLEKSGELDPILSR
jgi:WS/DGAT/MGAT family acyltransferase